MSFSWCVSAASHVTGIKLPLLQGHTTVFGQNICHTRKKDNLLTIWEVLGAALYCLWSFNGT